MDCCDYHHPSYPQWTLIMRFRYLTDPLFVFCKPLDYQTIFSQQLLPRFLKRYYLYSLLDSHHAFLYEDNTITQERSSTQRFGNLNSFDCLVLVFRSISSVCSIFQTPGHIRLSGHFQLHNRRSFRGHFLEDLVSAKR